MHILSRIGLLLSPETPESEKDLFVTANRSCTFISKRFSNSKVDNSEKRGRKQAIFVKIWLKCNIF
jgi:hypothetical protein